jgi:hypothetical protein
VSRTVLTLPDGRAIDVRVDIGFSVAFARGNLLWEFTEGYDFFTVFAVFFPIATGVISPLNMVPQLDDVSRNFPRARLACLCVRARA